MIVLVGDPPRFFKVNVRADDVDEVRTPPKSAEVGVSCNFGGMGLRTDKLIVLLQCGDFPRRGRQIINR